MQSVIRWLCDHGRVIRHRSLAITAEVRAEVTIAQEADDVRHRVVRVARAIHAGPAVPPLYGVQLAASVGGNWTLTGYERLSVGAFVEDCTVDQS